MPIFQKCDESVRALANEILCQFQTHKPVLDARVTIDFVFAFAKEDERGNKTENALSKNGVKALGICKKTSLKDRALGHADAEISLDGDWWRDASDHQRRALLDHELHHIEVKTDVRGTVRDDLGRPVIGMRKHDFDFGWFKEVAARHGQFSMERIQAREMLDGHGQYFWPQLFDAKA